ncbi:MAG TPA: ChbG/HpnK family deacetylase, partial [Thermoanaerobaculia bacterium]|nr:ChbG/HpnK family deacetylase [Thermoanaerobaculia bacterium]
RAAPFTASPGRPGARLPARLALNALAPALARAARRSGLATTDRCCGFATTGATTERDLLRFAATARAGTAEWMAHPGLDSPALRRDLPWAYARFHWSGELAALCSPAVREACRRHRLELIRFADL